MTVLLSGDEMPNKQNTSLVATYETFMQLRSHIKYQIGNFIVAKFKYLFHLY